MVFEEVPSDFSPRFHVASCYIEYDGKVLFVLRHPSKPQGNTWCVPGGKVENGEDAHEVVVREVKEETSVTLKKSNIRRALTHFVRHLGYDFVYHTFHVRSKSPLSIQLDPIDNIQYQWLTPNDALMEKLLEDEDICLKKYFKL